MSFNDIFSGWYTDTVEVFRVVPGKSGGITVQEREKAGDFRCRVYNSQKSGLNTKDTAARVSETDTMAVPLDADVKEGDELHIIRGGAVGHIGKPERYFAGRIMEYRDPVGGLLTGLQHKEVGLLLNKIVR